MFRMAFTSLYYAKIIANNNGIEGKLIKNQRKTKISLMTALNRRCILKNKEER